MFDVCTNTWTTAPGPGDIGIVTDFVYDVEADRAIAFTSDADGRARVASYEPATQTWTVKSEFSVSRPTRRGGPFPWLKAAYDPVTGLLVVLEPSTAAMWTYDIDTDTWTEIDQGTTWPPHGDPFLTYDASVDRLVLHHIGVPTWEFDIRAGRWEEHTSNTPDLDYWGWGTIGEEFVYDEANQVSVFLSDPVLTYDASEHRWTTYDESEYPGGPYAEYRNLDSDSAGWTYDSVNRRILFLGTGWRDTRELERLEIKTAERDMWRIWEMTAGVLAFDVATGEWITLLEPTTE